MYDSTIQEQICLSINQFGITNIMEEGLNHIFKKLRSYIIQLMPHDEVIKYEYWKLGC